jgi:hypothetical protein
MIFEPLNVFLRKSLVLILICGLINDLHIMSIQTDVKERSGAFKRKGDPSLQEHTGQLNVISRHAFVHKPVLKDHKEGPRHLPRLDCFERLLNGNLLKVDER